MGSVVLCTLIPADHALAYLLLVTAGFQTDISAVTHRNKLFALQIIMLSSQQ